MMVIEFMHRFSRAVVPASLAMVLVAVPAGCETGGQTGGLLGAGLGALAGQAIGGDTESTLIGAAVGGGVGYVIGNEQDKQKARDMSSSSSNNGYRHNEVGVLGGTRWRMVSVTPTDAVPPHTSRIVEFRRDGRAITTTTHADGRVTQDDESYRVVGRTLVINRPGYLVNARFAVDGDRLIMDAEDFSAVFDRVR